MTEVWKSGGKCIAVHLHRIMKLRDWLLMKAEIVYWRNLKSYGNRKINFAKMGGDRCREFV